MPEQEPPVESQPSAESAADETVAAGSASKLPMPPAVALAFVIIALLGVLIVMGLRIGMGGGNNRSSELTELQGEANALRDQLNRERMAMGLRPLEGGSEPVEDIAARLKKDADTMVALATSFQSMLSEKDTELTAKNSELLRAAQLQQTLVAESERLRSELQNALVGSSQMELYRANLDAMTAQRDALAAQLASVRGELANATQGVSQADFDDLSRQFEETLRAKEFFEARVQELEGEVSKAKLFASSENELLPAAVELFRSLRKLEGKKDSDLTTEYSKLGVDLGANVLRTIDFATGSSQIDPEDSETIRALVSDIPDGDLLFVVGYASVTGNVDGNRTLSSDRATAVAELYSSVKRPEQKVQAVYLGQTNRFSSRIPERNQMVEIWHIRRKGT